MAGEVDATALDVSTPEVWRPQVLEGRYEGMKLGKRVLRADAEVQSYGDIIHVPIAYQFSVNDVTAATGAVANQDATLTEAQITVDQWREVTIDVVDMANKQSKVNALSEFPKDFGRAIGEDIDNKLYALITAGNFTTNSVGDSSTSPDEDLLLQALEKLMIQKVPTNRKEDMTWCFYPKDWRALKKQDVFSDANVTGLSRGGGLQQELPEIYGIPVIVSSLIDTATNARNNALLHRHALGMAMQSNFQLTKLAKINLSERITGHALYGVKIIRETHGCIILTDD